MAKQVLGKVMMTFKDTYDSTTNYEILDVVTYDGSTYVAKKETTGNVPTNEQFWALLVKRPIKGLDYFTDEEKEEFVASITENANSVFNQNMAEKTGIFNTNFDNKTTELNTNFTNKINELNENVTNQISSIDSHVESKLTEVDTHITEQTTTFDNHVAEKTTDFDTNADNRMNDFNENASGFIKNTDYAKDNKIGVIKTGNNLATGSDGKIYGISSSLEEYQSNPNASIISKGTLENIKNNYVKEGVSSDEVKQELINQEFVQEDTIDSIVPNANASGELVQVDDALDYKLFGVEVEATEVSKQDTTEGRNLFDVNDRLSSKWDNNNVIIMTDDFIKVEYDNTDGTDVKYINFFTKISNLLKSSTQYSVVTEIKSFSGNFQLYSISTYEDESPFITSIIKSSKNIIEGNKYVNISQTKEDISAATTMLRSFVSVPIGEKIEVTLRLSLIEGTEIDESTFNYEPYTRGQASPNPNYPQEIETIKEITLKIKQNEEVTSIPIDLKGNEIVKLSDDVKDKLLIDKKGNISLVKNTKKIVLSGNEDWRINKAATTENGYIEYPIALLTMKNGSLLLCNKMQTGTKYDSKKEQIRTRLEDQNLYLNIALSRLESDSIESIKKFLSENNITVYYTLAEQEIISLGNLSQLIKTYKGYNNIWIESNLGTTIDVVYAKDLEQEIGNISKLLEVI